MTLYNLVWIVCAIVGLTCFLVWELHCRINALAKLEQLRLKYQADTMEQFHSLAVAISSFHSDHKTGVSALRYHIEQLHSDSEWIELTRRVDRVCGAMEQFQIEQRWLKEAVDRLPHELQFKCAVQERWDTIEALNLGEPRS